MKCARCGEETYVNYGTEEQVLCNNCNEVSPKSSSHGREFNEVAIISVGRIITIFGFMYTIFQAVDIFSAVAEGYFNAIMLVSLVAGFLVIAAGLLIPVFVSIAQNLSEINKKISDSENHLLGTSKEK